MKKKRKPMSEYYYEMDKYVERAGGAAKLSILLQKRAKELIKGLPKLVDTDSDNPVEIAIEELFQDKISIQSVDELAISLSNEKEEKVEEKNVVVVAEEKKKNEESND